MLNNLDFKKMSLEPFIEHRDLLEYEMLLSKRKEKYGLRFRPFSRNDLLESYLLPQRVKVDSGSLIIDVEFVQDIGGKLTPSFVTYVDEDDDKAFHEDLRSPLNSVRQVSTDICRLHFRLFPFGIKNTAFLSFGFHSAMLGKKYFQGFTYSNYNELKYLVRLFYGKHFAISSSAFDSVLRLQHFDLTLDLVFNLDNPNELKIKDDLLYLLNNSPNVKTYSKRIKRSMSKSVSVPHSFTFNPERKKSSFSEPRIKVYDKLLLVNDMDSSHSRRGKPHPNLWRFALDFPSNYYILRVEYAVSGFEHFNKIGEYLRSTYDVSFPVFNREDFTPLNVFQLIEEYNKHFESFILYSLTNQFQGREVKQSKKNVSANPNLVALNALIEENFIIKYRLSKKRLPRAKYANELIEKFKRLGVIDTHKHRGEQVLYLINNFKFRITDDETLSFEIDQFSQLWRLNVLLNFSKYANLRISDYSLPNNEPINYELQSFLKKYGILNENSEFSEYMANVYRKFVEAYDQLVNFGSKNLLYNKKIRKNTNENATA